MSCFKAREARLVNHSRKGRVNGGDTHLCVVSQTKT